MYHSTELKIIAVLALVYYFFQVRRKRNAGLPFPPGPRPYPLIGNLGDLPLENEVSVYNGWAREYGPLVYANILGRHLFFVNSAKVVSDLFEKRSANYSDRALSPMINDLMGWDWSFGHMKFGERWKRHRRMFDSRFRASMIHKYRPIQIEEAHTLLREILVSPNEAITHFRHNAASTIMRLVYGIKIAEQNDPFIDVAEQAVDGMAKAAVPGAFLVEILPILKYIPGWMPGAGFQRQAAEWKRLTLHMRDAPFQAALQAILRGTASPCFVSDILNDLNYFGKGYDDFQMETLKGCAGMAYAAGGEGIVGSLSSFLLAMVMYPEVQAQAQQELDYVVGRDRLPGYADRPSLPYINALIKELLRWNPVAPLGLPHMVTNDDVYNGYFIPAGSIVIGNTWTMLHNEETYPEPLKFSPERFLPRCGNNPLPPDPAAVAFGYGRRMCPGRYMAESQLYIVVASLLAVFNISAGLDEHGNQLKPVAAFTSGLISRPQPFRWSIEARDDAAKVLIHSNCSMRR